MHMSLAVIFDGMPPMHNLSSNLRIAAYLFPDTEERRLRAMLLQQLQYPRRNVRVRAIVNRNGNGAACRGNVR